MLAARLSQVFGHTASGLFRDLPSSRAVDPQRGSGPTTRSWDPVARRVPPELSAPCWRSTAVHPTSSASRDKAMTMATSELRAPAPTARKGSADPQSAGLSAATVAEKQTIVAFHP